MEAGLDGGGASVTITQIKKVLNKATLKESFALAISKIMLKVNRKIVFFDKRKNYIFKI